MPRFKLKNIYVLIPPIVSLVTFIYVVYMLIFMNANTISSNLTKFLMYIPIPLSLLLDFIKYLLSPYTIGLLGIALTSLSIYRGRYSRAAIILTLIYLYNILFSADIMSSIPLYITGLLVLLISYNWARGLYYAPTTILAGKVKLTFMIVIEYALVYVITLAFSSWYTMLLSHILYALPSKLPYPLSTIYSTLMETRIGTLIITIIVFYALLWLINQFTETIILGFTITRDIALSMVRRELSILAKKLLVIESYGIMDYAASFLVLIPMLPLIFSGISNVLERFITIRGPAFNLLTYGSIFLIYLIFARIIKGIIKSSVEGRFPFRLLLVFSIGLIILVLALYVINGYNPLIVIKETIIGNGVDYDPLKEYILKFEDRVISIENYVKYLEQLIKFLIHLIWG